MWSYSWGDGRTNPKGFTFFIFKLFIFSYLFICYSLIPYILTISYPPSTPPGSLPPARVTRVGKLILKSQEWGNRHCSPSAVTFGRAASTPRLDSTEELTLLAESRVSWARQHESRRLDPTPFVYHVVEWVRKTSQLHCPLPAVAFERVDSRVTGEGNLTLLLNSFSTGERRPCPLSGQHTRADPIGRGTAEPGMWAWEQECCPCPLPRIPWGGKDGVARVRKMCPPPISLATWVRQESLPWGPKNEPRAALWRVDPAPYLGKTGELALEVWVHMSQLWTSESRTVVSPCCLLQWMS